MVCRSQLSEVLLAEGPRYAPVQQGLHHLGLSHAQLQSERGSLHIVQFPLESTVACQCESDPPFDLWHNIGACVDKAAQIQKLRCPSIPLACCLDDER